MPLKVNELIIQAKFDSEEALEDDVGNITGSIDIELLREEIIRECMDKVEEYLKKKELR